MDQSRRAVESYWRSRMIDGATSDEDKVTPVYKLEEICELLRSSHSSIVKEVSEFILKRLQHKSPIVKQKALRVIKFGVGKSGTEFRREMQRNSVAVRQLIHYKGQPDPLKGDSLNKAVRETAQEALSAIFATEDSKPSPSENLGGRIQGFGNTNFEMPSDDRKSFLSEVVNIGSTTIKQGLSSLTQSPSLKKNETGTYRGPNLRRSLTTESDFIDQYEGVSSHGETYNSSRILKNAVPGNWGQDLRSSQSETTNGDSASSFIEKTREQRLLETIVTSGGVRLQPTRDALQVFLLEASKLDALAICHAIELKLQSPLWQVRMKAACVLEAMIRKKDDEHFSIVARYFSENKDLVVTCAESPQASLREKANKVLILLDCGQTSNAMDHQDNTSRAKDAVVQMPDLIDTGGPDNLFGTEEFVTTCNDNSNANPSLSTAPLIDDLFGEGMSTGLSAGEQKKDNDPFADVSFHGNSNKEQEADIFSGMTLDKSGATEAPVAGTHNGPELFDIYGSNSGVSKGLDYPKSDVNDLMTTLSITGNGSSTKLNGTSAGAASGNFFTESPVNPGHEVPSDILDSILASQSSGGNANTMFPMGSVPYTVPPGFIFNPSLAPQQVNYNAMGGLLTQQQFLTTMSNFQQLGNLQSGPGSIHSAASNGPYSSPLPDIFNPSTPTQIPASMMSSSKKEDSKAFDFISDHLAAARDPRRVV